MKVLIIGSGGREHALAWKIKQSPKVDTLFIAPGNAGTAGLGENINIRVDDINMLLAFAQKEAIDLTVVGPELPLVLGIVDAFEEKGLAIIGPGKEGSKFEGSKAYTKSFLNRYNIPTAAYGEYTEPDQAKAHAGDYGFPLVIKADGLAAGKGVVIVDSIEEANKVIDEMMTNHQFGQAGDKVVLEAFLRGYEASILCFVDGETILPMQPAEDYKKALNGDLGLNTGGMGTYSPSKMIDEIMMDRIQVEILNPFIKGIKADGIDFKGILFVGLMIDGDTINVLEYNVRMGDPETEVTLPRLENDIIDIFDAILGKRLNEISLKWSDDHAVCVIMASGGYPDNYEKGYTISGIDTVKDAIVFHCGTKTDDSRILTNGGRVLGVTALGNSLEEARIKSYQSVEKIMFDKAYYRDDIGQK